MKVWLEREIYFGGAALSSVPRRYQVRAVSAATVDNFDDSCTLLAAATWSIKGLTYVASLAAAHTRELYTLPSAQFMHLNSTVTIGDKSVSCLQVHSVFCTVHASFCAISVLQMCGNDLPWLKHLLSLCRCTTGSSYIFGAPMLCFCRFSFGRSQAWMQQLVGL